MKFFTTCSILAILLISEAQCWGRGGGRGGRGPSRGPGRFPGRRPGGRPGGSFGGGSFGGGSFGRPTTTTPAPTCQEPNFNNNGFPQTFTDTLNNAPNNITNLPSKPLVATYENVDSTTILTAPGAVVTTDQAQVFPTLDFACDPAKLYTAMIYDTSPGFFHGIYQNIPCVDCQLDVSNGEEVFEYIPSFAFGEETLDNGTVTLGTNPPPSAHAILAYEQADRIDIQPKLKACTPGQSFGRVLDLSVNPPTKISPDTIAAEYNLTPIAGNYFRNIYSGESSNKQICALLACEDNAFLTGFNVIIPGVNNIPSAVAAGEPNCVDQYGIQL